MRTPLLTADLYGSARQLRDLCDSGGNPKVKPLFTVYGDILTFHQKHLLSPLIGEWRSKSCQVISRLSGNSMAGIDRFVKFGFDEVWPRGYKHVKNDEWNSKYEEAQ